MSFGVLKKQLTITKTIYIFLNKSDLFQNNVFTWQFLIQISFSLLNNKSASSKLNMVFSLAYFNPLIFQKLTSGYTFHLFFVQSSKKFLIFLVFEYFSKFDFFWDAGEHFNNFQEIKVNFFIGNILSINT